MKEPQESTITPEEFGHALQQIIRESRFFIYMVLTSRGHFYTGISTCPEMRVEKHNRGKGGAKCLRGQRPVELVWRTPFPHLKSVALKLERKIKKLSHKQKQEIIDKYAAGHVFRFPDGERLW